MTECDSQANRQWSKESRVRLILITNTAHNKDEHKSEEELDAKSLQWVDTFRERCMTKSKGCFAALGENFQRKNGRDRTFVDGKRRSMSINLLLSYLP